MEQIINNKDLLISSVSSLLELQTQISRHTILIVDDEENNLQLLKRTLRNSYNILSAANGVEATKVLQEKGGEISLIVSDQRMPQMTGTEFLKIVNEKYPDIVKILLTGNTDLDIIIQAINECHLYQYVMKPFEPEDLKNMIETGLSTYELKSGKIRILQEMKELFYTTIKSISSALDAKDKYTHGHALRVTLYSLMLAKALQVPETDLETIEIAGLLHDIGKIGIPQAILCKNGKLTDEEYKVMCTHPAQGKKMVNAIKQFDNISEGISAHHEKWNGHGYPLGLKEEEIPYIARIIAIADTYDAMTSTRSYRQALSHEVAIAEINRCKGEQFDPHYAEVFVNIESIIRKAQEAPEEYYQKYSTIEQFLSKNNPEQVRKANEKIDLLQKIDETLLLSNKVF